MKSLRLEHENSGISKVEGCNIPGEIQQTLVKLDKWLQSHNYEGYEPYDALTSYLRPLAVASPLAKRILQQMVLRCPFHIRPLLGIQATKSASGMGLLARGYLRMWVLTKDVE